MAGPITWKNVTDRTDYGAIADLSRQSSRGFANAFGQVEGMIEDRNTRVTDANTNAFTDRLNSMSMEQLQQGRDDGSIQDFRSSFGTMINQDETRDMDRNLLTGLREEANATSTYNTQVAVDAAKPFMQSIGAQINAGDYAGAKQSIAANEEALTAAGTFNLITGTLRDTQQQQQERGLRMQDAGEVRTLRHQNLQYQQTLGESDPTNMTEQAYVDQFSNPEFLQKNGLRPETVSLNTGKARAHWRSKNSLTEAQATRLGTWEAEETFNVDSLAASNERTLEESLSTLMPTEEGERWTQARNIDDIATFLASPEVDANGNLKEDARGFDEEPANGVTLKDQVLEAQNLFRKTTFFTGLTKKQQQLFNREAINQITYDAAQSITSDEYLPGFGKDNLEPEELMRSMLSSAMSYGQYNDDRIRRDDYYKIYNDTQRR